MDEGNSSDAMSFLFSEKLYAISAASIQLLIEGLCRLNDTCSLPTIFIFGSISYSGAIDYSPMN